MNSNSIKLPMKQLARNESNNDSKNINTWNHHQNHFTWKCWGEQKLTVFVYIMDMLFDDQQFFLYRELTKFRTNEVLLCLGWIYAVVSLSLIIFWLSNKYNPNIEKERIKSEI